MEAKKIEIIKYWSKTKFVQDIEIFLEFVNFY